MGDREDGDLRALQAILAAVPDDMALMQLRALVAIAVEPGLSVNELAERIGVPQQTASRHVAALLGRYQDPLPGTTPRVLAEQGVSQDDPRRRALFVSGEGSALLAHIIEAATGRDDI